MTDSNLYALKKIYSLIQSNGQPILIEFSEETLCSKDGIHLDDVEYLLQKGYLTNDYEGNSYYELKITEHGKLYLKRNL